MGIPFVNSPHVYWKSGTYRNATPILLMVSLEPVTTTRTNQLTTSELRTRNNRLHCLPTGESLTRTTRFHGLVCLLLG